MGCKECITGQYLTGEKKVELPAERRSGNGKFIKIKGAKENNLKNVNVDIPLGTLTMVTGVSGSGKSTLINQILYKGLNKLVNKSKNPVGAHREILGYENIDKIIDIANSIGIKEDEIEQYGKYKAKISLDVCKRLKENKNGKLILVTAINPTPLGEGKTTISIGLADGLRKIGKKSILALREPSLRTCIWC